MRSLPIALLMLTMTTVAFAQEPAEPKEIFGKPILAVDYSGHEASVTDFDFAPDSNKVFTISVDNTIQVWDGVTREHLKTYRLPWNQGPRKDLVGFLQSASKLAVAPDGKILAVTLSNVPGIGTGGYAPISFTSTQVDCCLCLALPKVAARISTA